LKALLASGNRGKLLELRNIFRNSGLDLAACADAGVALPNTPETGGSYLENARLKAVALAELAGIPALADDSGLEVDALGGAPGIQSARYAGDRATDAENIARLLREMAEQPDRTARFRCVLVLAWPDGGIISSEGTLTGTIARTARGNNGFGYDPVFVLPDGRHAAELPTEEKDRISHRAVAANNLVIELGRTGKTGPLGRP